VASGTWGTFRKVQTYNFNCAEYTIRLEKKNVCTSQISLFDDKYRSHSFSLSLSSHIFHVKLLKFRIVFWDVLPCKIIVDRRFRYIILVILYKAAHALRPFFDLLCVRIWVLIVPYSSTIFLCCVWNGYQDYYLHLKAVGTWSLPLNFDYCLDYKRVELLLNSTILLHGVLLLLSSLSHNVYSLPLNCDPFVRPCLNSIEETKNPFTKYKFLNSPCTPVKL
jgi:hypothetical protein